LEGIQHLLHFLLKVTGVIKFDHLTGVAALVGLGAVAAHGPRIHLTNWWSLLSLTAFLFGLLHVPPFRRGVWRSLVLGYRTIAWFIQLPRLLFRISFIQAFFQSRLYLIFYQFVGKPLVYSFFVAWSLYFLKAGLPDALFGSGVMFVAMTVLFNSQFGQ